MGILPRQPEKGNINRGNIVTRFIDALKLDATRGFPVNASNNVVLTYDFKNATFAEDGFVLSSTTTGTQTITTLPSDRDFFVTDIILNVSANAACDSTYVQVLGTINGKTAIPLAVILKQTLTATQSHQAISFDTPVKLDRGTAITLSDTFTAGAQQKHAVIHGFYLQ